jgi:hypothetical protein
MGSRTLSAVLAAAFVLIAYPVSFIVIRACASDSATGVFLTWTGPTELPPRPWRFTFGEPWARCCWWAYRPLILIDEAFTNRSWIRPSDDVVDAL